MRGVVEHGQVVRIRGTTQDISDRKRTELALAKERVLLQTLLDQLPDVVALKSEVRRVAGSDEVPQDNERIVKERAGSESTGQI